MGKERPEVMTFNDIRARYRGQWVAVAITRIEYNEPVAGVVVAANSDKKVIADKVRGLTEREGAAGKPRPKIALFKATDDLGPQGSQPPWTAPLSEPDSSGSTRGESQ